MVAHSGWRSPTRWSDCSREQLADSFHAGMDYCLRDRPTPRDDAWDTAVCGNGLTEPGEHCDCGLESVGGASRRGPTSQQLLTHFRTV